LSLESQELANFPKGKPPKPYRRSFEEELA